MFLKRQPKAERPAQPARKSLIDGPHWRVHGVDLCRLLRELPSLLPGASLVGLAEGAWSPELRHFLTVHAVSIDPFVLQSLPREFSSAAFLPVSTDVLADLSRMAERLAEPEVAIHLLVAAANQALLEWYDLPDDPLAIAGSLTEDLVAHFAQEVGSRYERSRT